MRCRKEKAEPNRVMCKKCLEKERKRVAENREALRLMRICPRCGSNKLWGDEKMCIDCREKMYEYNKLHRSRRNKNYNDLRKKNGLCIKCGKRPPVQGKAKCSMCAAKERIRSREYRMRKGIDVDRSERSRYGRCYFCGVKIDSGEICDYCRERIMKNLPRASGNDSWKKDNKIIFGSKMSERKTDNHITMS